MKKLILLFVLGFAVSASAEMISTVSFNPSRLGNYDYLKVSREATFKGGLEVTNPKPSDIPEDKYGLNIWAKNSDDKRVTMELQVSNANENYYWVKDVKPASGATNVEVKMTGTTFRGGEADGSDLGTNPSFNVSNISDEPNDQYLKKDGESFVVKIYGGTLTSDNDSYVGKIDGQNYYQHYTKNLNVYDDGRSVGTLKIGDENTAGAPLTKWEGNSENPSPDGTTQGFHLAGVDIPHPKGNMCEGNSNLENCGKTKPYTHLCWVPRCTESGQVAWVLGVTNNMTCESLNAPASCGTGTGDGGNGGGSVTCTNNTAKAQCEAESASNPCIIWNSAKCECFCKTFSGYNFVRYFNGNCQYSKNNNFSNPLLCPLR